MILCLRTFSAFKIKISYTYVLAHGRIKFIVPIHLVLKNIWHSSRDEKNNWNIEWCTAWRTLLIDAKQADVGYY